MNDGDKVVLPVDRFKNLAAALSGVYDSQITGGKRYDVAVAGRRTAHASFFESHATDKADALSFAMDLTPLVEDERLDVLDYTLGSCAASRARSATGSPGSAEPAGWGPSAAGATASFRTFRVRVRAPMRRLPSATGTLSWTA